MDYQDDYMTATCRQCHETVRVHPDDPQPDGPYTCDSCVRETVNRAARSPLSEHVFNTAVALNRVMSKVYR